METQNNLKSNFKMLSSCINIESEEMKKLPLCGILNINKPAGLTSRQVVNHVQRIVKPIKVGHAGTLDPMATGVLAVCVGKATRLVPYIQQYHKQYVAKFLLGKQSDTDDITGNVIDVMGGKECSRSEIEALLPQFRGKIQQIPPQFSAVHVDGKRAYRLARKGEEVTISSREVEIFELELTQFNFPELTLEMKCGSGTYVRSVGRDIGELLKSGAVMTQLVRTEIGCYQISDAVDLEEITVNSLPELLLPPQTALLSVPQYELSSHETKEVSHGRKVILTDKLPFKTEVTIALFTPENELACLAEYQADKKLLAPRMVFL